MRCRNLRTGKGDDSHPHPFLFLTMKEPLKWLFISWGSAVKTVCRPDKGDSWQRSSVIAELLWRHLISEDLICTHTHTHIRAHTNTHTHARAHTHTYAHTLKHTHTQTHAHMYTHTHTQTHVHTHTHTYIHTPTHTHIHTHAHTHTHTRTYTLTHTHTYTDTYTHTHTHTHTHQWIPKTVICPRYSSVYYNSRIWRFISCYNSSNDTGLQSEVISIIVPAFLSVSFTAFSWTRYWCGTEPNSFVTFVFAVG